MRHSRHAVAFVITALVAAGIGACSEGVQPVDGSLVATAELSPPHQSVPVGDRVAFALTLKDASGATVDPAGFGAEWSTTNTARAVVVSTGPASATIEGVAAGDVSITVSVAGKTATAQLTVTSIAVVPVASITVTPVSPSVAIAATTQLTAVARDAAGNTLSGRPFTWSTNPTGVVTVSGTGLVTGVAAGTTTVTATAEGRSGSTTVTVPSPAQTFTLVGAGDIADCTRGTDELTADLLDNIPGTVFTAGDNAYPNGTFAEYNNCYHSTWGRQKARTRPSPGNHEYNTSSAAGYYDYFNGVGVDAGAAGERSKGYYSYDLGAWHIVALNSEISVSSTSAQVTWLKADLAASTKRCTLAYWHKPLFTSGDRGRYTNMQPIWQALQDAGAEVVISGHDHFYERFAPQTAAGVADAERGIRMFLVGTGGARLYEFGTIAANSEVRNNTSHGVIKFTLADGSYTWQFVPAAGYTFTDTGTASCR